jgi:protein N-terminal amidase
MPKSHLGYNFPNLEAIQPHLEPTASGPSTQWALTTARRLNCLVVVGYPEVALDASSLPSNVSSASVFAPDHAGLIKAGANYNSAVTVSPDGHIVAHYRKSFLYFTDATWAIEGPGFHAGMLPLRMGQSERVPPAETRITMGVCMDINPYNC